MTTSHNAETHLSSIHPHKPAPFRALRMRKLALMTLIMIIIACVSYALLTIQSLTKQMQALSVNETVLKQQQTDTQSLLTFNLEKLDAQQESLRKQLEGVSANLSQALQERGYQSHDWVLLKARYYLELADINSTWGHNKASTLALLQQADDLLVNLQDPELSNVRQALIKEMTQLQINPGVDLVSLLVKLDVVQQRVTQLSIKNPFNLEKDKSVETKNNGVTSSWRAQMHKSLLVLKQLVLIRHHDEAVEPLLSPEHESILRETCLLNLQEAQWAVTQQNQELYLLSLKQAVNTINRAFDLKEPNTQSLLKEIQTLQQMPLERAIPLSKEPLLLLNQIIKSQKNRTPSSTSKTDETLPESNETTPASGEKS